MYPKVSNQNDKKTLKQPAPLDVRGFLETSFLDWDGKISAVVFVAGCNFRCPFCHNSPLVLEPKNLKAFSVEEIDSFITERQDFIDGVVITGGEPCLHKGLPEFCKHYKDLGFLVKLDTNGTNPDQLKDLIDQKLIDCVAMDIKAPFDERYNKTAGAKVDLEKIKESAKLLMLRGARGFDYEFRLTVVPGLIDEKEIEEIGKTLRGAKKFVLQQFVPENCLDKSYAEIKPYNDNKLRSFQLTLKQYIHNTVLRGV